MNRHNTHLPKEGSSEFLAIVKLIKSGEFRVAGQQITEFLMRGDSPEIEQDYMRFELERMIRIRKDFCTSSSEVIDFIRKYVPEVSADDIQGWELAKSLEYRIIEGNKYYFESAARNLFRIDPALLEVWNNHHSNDEVTSGSGAKSELDKHNLSIIQETVRTGETFVNPVQIRIRHQLEVKADAIPDQETIRCWLPYPRQIRGRQTDIQYLRSDPTTVEIASEGTLQRTIYLEKPARKGHPTLFQVEYELTSMGVHQHIDPHEVVEPKIDQELAAYLKEEPPHIIFSPRLQKLSRGIVGAEQNPYKKAQLIFAWMDKHVPWASAREYSTISCIPEYAASRHHGDCGIQTLLFISLCRLNGIPARWQSGWELQPPDDSMHDWGMIYFEPYGWVPMDITYGLRNTSDPHLKWFYLGGMDSYRIIFNDDIAQDFSPPKQYYRSETLDSQRGEVEWSGGNLYFDQWQWKFDWEILAPSEMP